MIERMQSSPRFSPRPRLSLRTGSKTESPSLPATPKSPLSSSSSDDALAGLLKDVKSNAEQPPVPPPPSERRSVSSVMARAASVTAPGSAPPQVEEARPSVASVASVASVKRTKKRDKKRDRHKKKEKEKEKKPIQRLASNDTVANRISQLLAGLSVPQGDIWPAGGGGGVCLANVPARHTNMYKPACLTGRSGPLHLCAQPRPQPVMASAPSSWMEKICAPAMANGPTSDIHQAVKRCLHNLGPGSKSSVRHVSELEQMLSRELERVRTLKLRGKGVAQTLHDLLNELTGSHVPPDVLHGIAESLCEAVADDYGQKSSSDSSSNSSSPESSSDSSTDSSSEASRKSEKRLVRKTSRRPEQIVRRVSARLDKQMSHIMEGPPPDAPPVNNEPITAPPENQLLQAAQADWNEERTALKGWAESLKTHYETKAQLMKDGFDRAMKDMQERMAREQDLSHTLAEAEYRSKLEALQQAKEYGNRETQKLAGDLRKTDKDLAATRKELTETRDKLEQTTRALHKADVTLMAGKKEVAEKQKELDAEAAAHAALCESLVASLQESQKQIDHLEDQSRKIKKDNLDGLEVRSRFKQEMAGVKEKLNTLLALINDLRKELTHEKELRTLVETELNQQRDFLEHAEAMVAESDAKAAESKEENVRLKKVTREAKTACAHYKSLWKDLRSKVEQMESLALEVEKERVTDTKMRKAMEDAMEEDRKTVLEQEEKVNEMALQLRHFADVAGRHAKEVENLKDALRKALNELTDKNVELREAILTRDQAEMRMPMEVARMAHMKETIEKMDEGAAVLRAKNAELENLQNEYRSQALAASAEADRLRKEMDVLQEASNDWKTRYTRDIIDTEARRSELMAAEARVKESLQLKDELKVAYEEEISRRDRMWREACDVLEKRLRDEYTHTDQRLAEARSADIRRKPSSPLVVKPPPIEEPKPSTGLAVDDLDKLLVYTAEKLAALEDKSPRRRRHRHRGSQESIFRLEGCVDFDR